MGPSATGSLWRLLQHRTLREIAGCSAKKTIDNLPLKTLERFDGN
jgi:hypothetical protein